MSASAIAQTLKLPLKKPAEPLIGSSAKDWSFTGAQVNGQLNKSLKPITSAKSTHWTNPSYNNLNTICTAVTKCKSITLNCLPKRSSALQFGLHWQVESWQESTMRVSLKEVDLIRTLTWNISSKDISMRPRRNRLWKDWENSRN